MINSLRWLRLLLLKLCVKLTPRNSRLKAYGIAAGSKKGLIGDVRKTEHGWVCSVEQGVSTARGETLDKHSYLYPECSFTFIDRPIENQNHEIMRIGWDKFSPNIHYVTQPVITLSTDLAYQKNYFHWLFDILPRIKIAREFSNEECFYYCQNEFSFQRDSLAALGIGTEKIIPLQEQLILQSEKLIVPSTPNAFRDLPKWASQFLIEELKPQLINTDLAHQREKVFVSRSDAQHRRAVNEIQLEERMIERGFKVIQPGSMSISEQANTFSRADSVVALHSASLANLIFCNPGTKILEIAPPRYEWELFEVLADHCGLDYRRVKAAKVEDIAHDRFDYQKVDFEIDFEIISDELDWACN